MASVNDVAAYILSKQGTITAMKLQKLAYYSQAWHLVWEEAPLFDSRIEAWANGPVVRELYRQHRGEFSVSRWESGDASALKENERSTVDSVLSFYGDMSAHALSELTHREAPWKDAREGLTPDVRCDREITTAAMHEYYDSLTSQSN